MIFNPTDRRSGQNPQSGGQNNSLGRQVINAIFGRLPVFFNAALADQIFPIVDSTLYFPLTPITKERTLALPAIASSQEFRLKPDRGKHWMVSFLQVDIDSNVALIIAARLLIQSVQNTIQQTLVVQKYNPLSPAPDFLIAPVGGINYAPLVGGKRQAIDTTLVVGVPVMVTYEGVKSVYVNSDMELIAQIASTAPPIAGTPCRVVWTYLELPESQPFGPALTL